MGKKSNDKRTPINSFRPIHELKNRDRINIVNENLPVPPAESKGRMKIP
jgi:hypothetical protein